MTRQVDWSGFFPAVVTPFGPDGAILWDGFTSNIQQFIGEGVGGIVVCGHNGEPWSMTAEERASLVRAARRAVDESGRRVPVIAGADAVSSQALVQEARRLLEAGADGVMVTPPFFVATATEEEILYRYETLARHIDAPIMLYNNPRRTGINLTPEMIARLADIDGVAAVKQSIRDYVQLSETIRLAGDRLRVFCGPSCFILPGVLSGAAGYVSTGPDILGKVGAEYFHLIKGGHLDRAVEIHNILTQLYSVLHKYGTWPAALKVALNLAGKVGGVPRDPVMPLDAAGQAAVKAALDEIGVIGVARPVGN